MDSTAQDLRIVQIPIPTRFPVGPANVYLLLGDVPTLIDTGPCTDEGLDIIRNALREQGLEISDLERIIITHGHTDHIGLLGRLMDESGAETYGHPLVRRQGEQGGEIEETKMDFLRAALHEGGTPHREIEKLMEVWGRSRLPAEGFEIHHVIEDGGAVEPFTAYHVPGHSASDTLFVHESKTFSITGDHVLKTVNPSPLLRQTYPNAERDRSLVEFQASLKRTRTLELGTCWPGHGEPFDDGWTVIDQLLERHEVRTRQVRRLMTDERQTAYDILQGLFPNMKFHHLTLGLAEAFGHLELLEERGEAESEVQDGVRYFRPVPR